MIYGWPLNMALWVSSANGPEDTSSLFEVQPQNYTLCTIITNVPWTPESGPCRTLLESSSVNRFEDAKRLLFDINARKEI